MSEAIRDKSDLNIAYADQVAPERAVASASQQVWLSAMTAFRPILASTLP